MLIPIIGIAVAAIIALGVVATLAQFFVSRRVVVPTNMVHIVQSRRATTSYGKDRPDGNVYYAWPTHFPIVGVSVTVLPESVFCIEVNDYEAYDSGRVPFKVDIRAFFRIDDSNQAAHRVANFDQLEEQLTNIIQGSVRNVLATNQLENIMQERAKLGTDFTAQVDPQLGEWGVKAVKTIEFMDIRDHAGSQAIANIMAKEQSRIEKESRVAVAANKQSAQQAEIDAGREIALRKVDAEQTVGQRQAEQARVVGIAQQQSEQQVLEARKATTERTMEVKSISDVRTADIARQVAEVQATQEKNVAVTRAEGEKQKAVIVAEGALEAAKRQAEGRRATGEAEGVAATALQMAPVNAQLALAKEIGSNEGYQTYLVRVRQVEAGQAIGVAQADALAKADIKVIANGGTVAGGISSVTDIFSSAGGQAIGAMLEGLSNTAPGAAVVNAVTEAAAKVNGRAAK